MYNTNNNCHNIGNNFWKVSLKFSVVIKAIVLNWSVSIHFLLKIEDNRLQKKKNHSCEVED